MAKLMKTEARTVFRIERFRGLDEGATEAKGGFLCEMSNLRPTKDGTLRRRRAYAPAIVLEEAVRGAYAYEAEGHEWMFVVAGSVVYSCLHREDGTWEKTVIGSTASYVGEVAFVPYDGKVLLLDGEQILQLTPDNAVPLVPYIPLYGLNWSEQGGELLESRNLLTDLVHVRYLPVHDVERLLLRVDAVGVERVVIDGIPCEAFQYEAASASLNFDRPVVGGSAIDVVMRLPPDEDGMRSDFHSCRLGSPVGGIGESCVLFGCGRDKSTVFLSRSIERERRMLCRAAEPRATMLYLLPEDCLCVGNALHGVKACARQYDRVLLFTDTHTVMTDGSRDAHGALGMQAINSVLGCTSRSGAVTVGNSPITLCDGVLLRWTANTDRLDECNAERISAPISSVLAGLPASLGRLLYLKKDGEVWIYAAGKSAPVLIWLPDAGAFFRYDGIDPDGMLALSDGAAFYRGNTVFTFCDAAHDTDADGEATPIECRLYVKDVVESHGGRDVRVERAMICAEAVCGQHMELLLCAANGRRESVEFVATGDQPCEMVRRVRMGRSRHVSLRFRAVCEGDLRLRALALSLRT